MTVALQYILLLLPPQPLFNRDFLPYDTVVFMLIHPHIFCMCSQTSILLLPLPLPPPSPPPSGPLRLHVGVTQTAALLHTYVFKGTAKTLV